MKKLLWGLMLLPILFLVSYTSDENKIITVDKKMGISNIENREKINKKEIGFIRYIYETDGKKYIAIDTVEFYRGKDALKEAINDGRAVYDKENNKYWIPDGYYIRNSDDKIITYELDNSAEYYLCAYDVDKDYIGNASLTTEVSYDDMYEYITRNLENIDEIYDRANLFRIDITDNIVTSLIKQYTP